MTQHQPNRMHERTHAILVTPTTRNSFGNQDCICVIRIQKQPNKTHLALRPPCPCTSSTHHRSGSPSARCGCAHRPQCTAPSCLPIAVGLALASSLTIRLRPPARTTAPPHRTHPQPNRRVAWREHDALPSPVSRTPYTYYRRIKASVFT